MTRRVAGGVAAAALMAFAPAALANDLAAAVASTPTLPVHGTATTRYRLRTTDEATDQDVDTILDLAVGDTAAGAWSANAFVRAATDLDRAHDGEAGAVYGSIDDTHGAAVDALLYTAFVTLRPGTGPFDTVRIGRQYVFASETHHVDGLSATTRPLAGSLAVKLTAYAGVPVHFYEASARGDWLAGLRAEAAPWKGGRATLDYAHVADRRSLVGQGPENDLAGAALRQRVGDATELHGRFQWIDGAHDAELRATYAPKAGDLLVTASWYRLLEEKAEYATEFDPYTNVLRRVVRYDDFGLRASKGFGEHFDAEAGVSARRLLPGEDEGPFNRDVRRVHVTPGITDLPWKGTSASVTLESYEGGDEEVRTWGAEVAHKFSRGLRVSAGTDYTLYGFGPVGTEERRHVRTAFVRAAFAITKSLSADVRYVWENDERETFHALTLALALDF